MAGFEVSDVKKYRQVNGKEWWFVSYTGGDGSYSWQPGSEVQRVPASVRSAMAELRRRWILEQHYHRQCLSGLLWLLAGACLTLVGFGVLEAWDDLKGAPFGSKLYTLTLPCCWWLLLCCFLSVAFGVAAISQMMNAPKYVRGRASTRSGGSSRSSRSPAISRRRRASPYGRRRRAASPRSGASGASGTAATDPPTLGEVGLGSASTDNGNNSSNSNSGGSIFGSEGAFSNEGALVGLPPVIGDGPLNKKLTPRPSGEYVHSPSRTASAVDNGTAAVPSRQGTGVSKRQNSLVRNSSTTSSKR